MKNKLVVIGIMLLMFLTLVPSVSADDSTNEAIEDITISFNGTGNSTMITVSFQLNFVASQDDALIIKCWIDQKDDSHILGQTAAGSTQLETVWDITRWSQGFHVLIAEMQNPASEITYDSTADNRLDRPFCTDGWFWSIIGNFYGEVQYVLHKYARQTAGGTFAFVAGQPLWIWIIVIIVLVIIIKLIVSAKKKHKKPNGHYYQKAIDIRRFEGF